MTAARPLAGLLLGGLLAACAGLPTAQRATEPFDLLGRVLVGSSGRVQTSNLRWQHSAVQDELSLMTPTGQIVARIVDTPNGATLTTADQTEYQATSVEELTRRALGWALPLAQLQYWVRAQPAPGEPPTALQRDNAGRIAKLEQNGWRIDYQYPGEPPGAPPRRLELKNGDQQIRLVVDDWRAGAAP
jgi:outer membrane lipoprotein LolB